MTAHAAPPRAISTLPVNTGGISELILSLRGVASQHRRQGARECYKSLAIGDRVRGAGCGERLWFEHRFFSLLAVQQTIS